jgi:hypothetical protein
MLKRNTKRLFNVMGYKLHRLKGADKLSTDDIAFLHIGKNAGSQVMRYADIWRDEGVRIIKCHHGAQLRSIPLQTRYFFSIRNPAARFKSGFYSRKRKGQPRIYSEWSEAERIAFSEFEHANDLAESLFQPGDVGVRAGLAIKSISHTAMQQIDWFQGENILVDRPPLWIVRQESLEEDMRKLATLLGVVTMGDRVPPADPIKSHRNFYGEAPALSSHALDNLRKWYAQDYWFYDACVRWMASKDTA